MTAGSEQMREQGRRNQRSGESGARPARNAHGPGRGGLRILRLGVVAAGLRHGGAPEGTGEGDGADNDAPHRAAEPADEACANPLGGLGGEACGVERGWHWDASIVEVPFFVKQFNELMLGAGDLSSL